MQMFKTDIFDLMQAVREEKEALQQEIENIKRKLEEQVMIQIFTENHCLDYDT